MLDFTQHPDRPSLSPAREPRRRASASSPTPPAPRRRSTERARRAGPWSASRTTGRTVFADVPRDRRRHGLDPGGRRSGWARTTTTRRRRRPAASRSTASGSTASRRRTASSPTFVEDTGYVTVAERPLDPADFPGAPPENLVPGSLVFTMTLGPGRPAAPQPVVDVDAGRVLAAPRRAGQRRSPAATTTRSSTSPTRTPRRTRRGPASRCRPRPSGSGRPAAGSTARRTSGATSPKRPTSGSPTTGTATSPGGTSRATERRSPVGSYPANGYGLHDMAGNVWEWTADWYATRHPETPTSPAACRSTRGAARWRTATTRRSRSSGFPRKVIKGGSYLCADSYCLRYRPAARRPQMIDTGMSHIGFRCVVDRRRPERQRLRTVVATLMPRRPGMSTTSHI